MNTLKDEWNRFERSVIDPDAPLVQRREMRRAFYGGATAMLFMMLRNAKNSDAAGVALIESWRKEVNQFAVEVMGGRA